MSVLLILVMMTLMAVVFAVNVGISRNACVVSTVSGGGGSDGDNLGRGGCNGGGGGGFVGRAYFKESLQLQRNKQISDL